MAFPGGLIPIDGVNVSYKLINSNTLQIINNSFNYAQINNNQFVFLTIKPNLTSFDKRIKRVLLTFKIYSGTSNDISLKESNAGHFVSNNIISLRKYMQNNVTCYEADITNFVCSDPLKERYFAITSSLAVSIYINGLNAPNASLTTYQVDPSPYCKYCSERLMTSKIRNYCLNVDLLSLIPSHNILLFDYEDELVSFNLSLTYNFAFRATSSVGPNLFTGLPNGFKFNLQEFIYPCGDGLFTYIDENYFTHTFSAFENDDGTFNAYYDQNGSYLVMEIIQNGYKIYDLNGVTKIFTSGGLICQTIIQNGNYQSYITYEYTNGYLTSILLNDNRIITISYSQASISVCYLGSDVTSISYNGNNQLVTLIDQENVRYDFGYDETHTDLINDIIIENDKGIYLNYNNQKMLVSFSGYRYNDDEQDFEYDGITFTSNPNLTSVIDDSYHYFYLFNEIGQIIQTYKYKIAGNILSASKTIKNNGRTYYLTTKNAYYLRNAIYNSHNEPHFEAAQNLNANNSNFQISLYPKGNDRYYLYFEYIKMRQSSYQTNSELSISISVGSGLNSFNIIQNETLAAPEFNVTYIFMRDISFIEEYNGQPLNLNFAISNGEITYRVSSIRLYRLDSNNVQYRGINTNVSSNVLNFNEDDETYYELGEYLNASINNDNHSINMSYGDLLASMAYKFFFNKNVAFYNNGQNAFCGALLINNQAINNIKISISNYIVNIYDYSSDDCTGYNATFTYIDGSYFINKIVNYNYTFKTRHECLKKINFQHLLVGEISSIPYGETNSSNPNTGDYQYRSYKKNKCYSYNEHGQLIKTTTYHYRDDQVTHLFSESSGCRYYSEDNKHLLGICQYLYSDNQNVTTISSSYQYDSRNDVSIQTDGNGVSVSFNYNKFHHLINFSKTQNQLEKSNVITYDDLFRYTELADFPSRNHFEYIYSIDGTIKSVTNGNLSFNFSKSNDIENLLIKDGNNQYQFSNVYSSYNTIYESKINGERVLGYYYRFKYDNDEGIGNLDTDYLSEIYDYKDINNIKRKCFFYNDRREINKIRENGVEIEFTSSYFPNNNESDCGFVDKAIKNTVLYKDITSNNIFRLENSYTMFSNSLNPRKTIADEDTFYKISLTYNYSKEQYSGSSIALGTYYGENFHNSISVSFKYYQDEDGNYTSLIKNYRIWFNNASHDFSYFYNNNGQINNITNQFFNINSSYTYNSFNELISENSVAFGLINYSYDNYGNITNINRQIDNSSYQLTYDNQNRLTSYIKTTNNGVETYNCSNYIFGCPHIYKNKQLSWDYNKLTQYDNISFIYDGYNRRINKHSLNKNVDYLYINDVLLQEVATQNNQTYKLKYFYGNSNSIIGFIFEQNVYFYIKDAQNNVVAIINQDNNIICKYLYDAYGNHSIIATGSYNNLIANLNPYRYRSYYYDEETGLYWLLSRYYDPEIGRFISPDSVDYLDPTSINGLNLYAYCNNDPVNFTDPSGHITISIGLLLAGFVIGALVGTASSIITQGLTDGFDNINGWQVLLDGTIGGVSGLLAFSGIGALGSALISGGLGFVGSVGGDLIKSNGNWSEVNWGKAAVMTGMNFLLGWGPGVQNSKAIGKSLSSALSGNKGYNAILKVLANPKVSAKGIQGTINLYGKSLSRGVYSVLPGIMMSRINEAFAVMLTTSASCILFDWGSDYFGFWC